VAADALTVHHLAFHLYRRVVEIWDGRLALQPYVDPRVADRVKRFCRDNGMAGEELRALAEAASLAAALRAKAQEQPVRETAAVPPSVGGADVAADAAFLGKVAHYLLRSPLVPAILADLDDDPADRSRAGDVEPAERAEHHRQVRR
jgi:hypothetical protein